MLHVGHYVLEHRVRDIADEQIVLRVPVREEGIQSVRVFSYHGVIFVFSVTCCQGSWYQLPFFVVLVTNIRGFSYRPFFFTVLVQRVARGFPPLNTNSNSIF
jgi:hypothetical protein